MEYIYERDKVNYFKKFIIIAGNLFVITSLITLSYIFYPIFSLYLNPPVMNGTTPTQGMYLIIPKINAQAQIISHIDKRDQSAYLPALEKGIAHAKGSAFPGENGTTFLFAHDSGMPWQLTRTNTLFFKLNDIGTQDSIVITIDGKVKEYYVWNKKEVWPEEVEYLINAIKDNVDKNQLIIQTSTPVGTSFKRLLIFAAPK